MKFLVTKEINNSPFFKYLMGVLTIFVLLFLVSDMVLHHHQIGLTTIQATTTLHGNEESFEEPILLTALLLQVHIDLFLSMFILLILSTMFIRLYAKKRYSRVRIHLLSISGLLSPILLLFSYFWSSVILFWISIFIFWHLISLLFCIMILWGLYRL